MLPKCGQTALHQDRIWMSKVATITGCGQQGVRAVCWSSRLGIAKNGSPNQRDLTRMKLRGKNEHIFINRHQMYLQ